MAQELKVHQAQQQPARAGGQAQRSRLIPALSSFDEIERLFDELMPSPLFRLGRSPFARQLAEAQARAPRVDVIERDGEFLLRAEVPGVAKDALDISVDESSVTIRGNVSQEATESEGDYYRREIVQGEFVRAVGLPAAVDTEKAKASLKDGILELILPKLEGAKRRKIEIK